VRNVAWPLVLVGILLGSSQAQSQLGETVIWQTHADIPALLTIPSVPRPLPRPPSKPHSALQRFECEGKVTLETCKQEVLKLKPLLDKYGADQLGQWKWVLVSSQEWETVLARTGFSPSVPAFTAPDARLTFFDDALLSGSPGRLSQLIDTWRVARSGLLDLAVRHELSHAFCRDQDESRAVRNAELLGEKRPPACGGSSREAHK
jgi:hypothetical protein